MDTNIVERLKKREESAFKELVDTYGDMVFRVCMGVLHNAADADDVTQEVFIEVYRSIQKFQSKSKLSTWLYRIALNKSLNHLRDNRRHKRALLPDKEQMEQWNVSATDADPLEVLHNQEKRQVLQKAIDALPQRQKKAFVLSQYEDLSYKEIADVMETSVSSVESLLFRARQNLQKELFTLYKRKF
ncbi:MAG: sigma-70 family RNA polymerase sigma factor [Bacteroidales bacterium]|nr:sigma-70 family RNA polymerase sigma factor [Bacteroidales bacterium]HHV40798.1 sigma-70 family RNA polymerase sigma factor [Bacteroidales bacterium]